MLAMRNKSLNIRDPLYGFIDLDEREAAILDTPPVQRLRHIHQLGLTSLVYPSATHKRLEHSLGVMHLAGKIFDVVTGHNNVYPDLEETVSVPDDERDREKRVVRLAALLHDVGHLPFSHAAEKELLPDGWNHELITVEFIKSGYLCSELENCGVDPFYVAKVAVGKAKLPDVEFTPWEELLSEIIVSDIFGADRMDYLLRDSYHLGVAYGHFDHYRLIQRLCILPDILDPNKPTLGIDEGGIHVAEELLLARYFMYTQVYFEETRRIIDRHLQQFLAEFLPEGKFSTNLEDYLRFTDNEIATALRVAANDPSSKGHREARRLWKREHFRFLGKRDPDDSISGEEFITELEKEFGQGTVILDKVFARERQIDFPVWRARRSKHQTCEKARRVSEVISKIPVENFEGIFCDPEKYEDISGSYNRILERLELPLISRVDPHS